MKELIAITGSTGFIGSNLVRKFAHEGYRLQCLARKESKALFLKELGAEIIYGDMLDKESLCRLVEDAAAVIHLAGIVSVSSAVKDPTNAFLVNTLGTLNLLECLRLRNKDCFIIYLSSDRVYGNPYAEVIEESETPRPIDPYGTSKLCAEYLCQVYYKTYSIPFIAIRGATVYGPSQSSDLLIPSFIRRLITSEGDTEVGNLETYRNFVHIEDIVSALYLAFLQREKAKGNIFNVSERAIKVKKVVNILVDLSTKYLGKTPKLIQNPSLVRRFETDGGKCELDCRKARQVLRWFPKVLLEKGLEETFKNFLEAQEDV